MFIWEGINSNWGGDIWWTKPSYYREAELPELLPTFQQKRLEGHKVIISENADATTTKGLKGWKCNCRLEERLPYKDYYVDLLKTMEDLVLNLPSFHLKQNIKPHCPENTKRCSTWKTSAQKAGFRWKLVMYWSNYNSTRHHWTRPITDSQLSN